MKATVEEINAAMDILYGGYPEEIGRTYHQIATEVYMMLRKQITGKILESCVLEHPMLRVLSAEEIYILPKKKYSFNSTHVSIIEERGLEIFD